MLDSSGSSVQVGSATTRLISHYELLIEDARALGERRERLNQLFLGVITLAVGAQAYLLVTYKDSDVRSTLLIVIVGLFGLSLTRIWQQQLRVIGFLLKFRYAVLKDWEEVAFPPEQRYYNAEDVLYSGTIQALTGTNAVESTSSDAHALNRVAQKFVAMNETIPNSVDIYRALPVISSLIFLTFILIRLCFLALTYVFPHGGPAISL